MSRNRQHSLVVGLAILGLTILGVLALAPLTLGQSASAPRAGIPVPTDWSHRHVIFSRPGTTEQAARVEKDPRYWQQRYRSQLPLRAPAVENGDAFAQPSPIESQREPESKNRKLHRDWAVSMGSGASSGADNFPATFSTLQNTASCGSAAQPDFVIYNTGLVGSATQASIVAYDNLYSGCGGTVPSVYWAYNTGGQILTSPVYSRDGTQVAFVQTNPASEGTIVLLKWAPASTGETVSTPTTLTAVGRAAYETCAPPCMTTRFLRNSSDVIDNDTSSSVFYDYGSDTAYVGDALGWLHKFTPFFKGVPNEIRNAQWPFQVNPANPTPLDSPVYDFNSGDVFVGDIGGFLYRVPSSAPSLMMTSGQLDFGAGIVEGPTVNPTLGLVYVFVSSDGSGNCAGGADCAAVDQLITGFGDGDLGSEAVVGNSVVSPPPNPNPLYGGDFDNNYRTSADGTGNLYVCGNTGGSPTLYQIAIKGGVMGTITPGPVLATGNPPCSPVTDVLNPNVSGGGTEWIFASAESGGTSTACVGSGCIFNFKDTDWQPSIAYSAGQEILDTNFHIEVVETTGTSGTSEPFWNVSTGGVTPDNTVRWLDQGLVTAVTPPVPIRSHIYATGVEILDSNNNIERATVKNGKSGGTAPVWNTNVGGSTTDGAQKWTNFGSIATVALPAAGGTSGIVVDNTIETLTGASQVYFSTLSDETCSTSATSGGCAVQASQSALH